MTGGPTEREILDDVSRLLGELCGGGPVEPLEPSTRFFADLGLASIDAVVLGESLQNHYRRRLPFADLMAEMGGRDDRDLSIGELVAFLRRHL